MSKEYIIFKATSVITNNDAHSSTQFAIAKGEDQMTVTDGYHTMDELYDHRVILYMALCKRINEEDQTQKSLKAFKEGFAFDPNGWIRKVWKSKKHSDGSEYSGWFILGINKEKGKQITYHIPMEYYEGVFYAEELDKAPEFDGHSSNDVLARIIEL